MDILENEYQDSTVHDALIKAVDESKEPQLVPMSIKVNPDHKLAADRICEANGTTLSVFLRKCMSCLIQDYIMKDPDQAS